MGLCGNGGHAEMVTDFPECRRIAAGFDEVFDKIKDFPLSLGELFQVSLPFGVVNWAWGECRNRQRGIPLLSLLLHSNFYRVAFARNMYT